MSLQRGCDGFTFRNNHVRRECVRRESVSAGERRRALQPRERCTTARTLGRRTLNAPMQTERVTLLCQRSTRTLRSAGRVIALALMAASSAGAQHMSMASTEATGSAATVRSASVLIDASQPRQGNEGVAELPDESGQRRTAPGQGQDATGNGRVAPIHAKYILAGVKAQPIGARDKMIIGLKDPYSVMNFAGMFAATGYEQLRNGEPHYGTDRGAFGERLGAAGIRDTAQGVLTDAVYAPLLHEDSRYYVEGPQYGTLHRARYALTRPLISRSDSGHRMINGAQLLGYASALAISEPVYPPRDRNAGAAAKAFGGSLGGAALGSLLIEFTSSFWHDFHIGPKE
jgi:hypothetical protein